MHNVVRRQRAAHYILRKEYFAVYESVRKYRARSELISDLYISEEVTLVIR